MERTGPSDKIKPFIVPSNKNTLLCGKCGKIDFGRQSLLLKVEKEFRGDFLSKSYLKVLDPSLAGSIIQNIKEPLDRRRKGVRHFQDCPEEVVHKLLDGSFGGQQAGEEYFRDRLVGSLTGLLAGRGQV